MKPATVKEAIQAAFREGVLVLKLKDSNLAWSPDSEEEIEKFLEDASFSKVHWPKPSATNLRYVRQVHVRGASLHEDFRYELGGGLVTGLTVTMPFGLSEREAAEIKRRILALGSKAAREEVTEEKNVPPAVVRALREDKRIRDIVLGRIEKHWLPHWLDWDKKKVCVEKSLQDDSWLSLDSAAFPPGTVGATDYRFGFMFAFDRGRVVFGAQKPDYRELYLQSATGGYTGRVVAIWLPKKFIAEDPESEEKLGRKAWVGYLFCPREQRPYVTTERCLESGWVPPLGQPCMPKEVAEELPEECRFWERKTPEARYKSMENLVSWADEQQWYTRRNPADWPSSLGEILNAG